MANRLNKRRKKYGLLVAPRWYRKNGILPSQYWLSMASRVNRTEHVVTEKPPEGGLSAS